MRTRHGLLLPLLSFLASWVPGATAIDECSLGRLFVSDVNSDVVSVYELDNDAWRSPIASVSLDIGQGFRLYTSSTGRIVTAVYMGNETDSFMDGTVSFILAGISSDVHELGGPVAKRPPKASPISLDCTRPIHHVSHKGQIAIFCDGYFDATPQLNSSVYSVSETFIRMGDSDRAIRFQTDLMGTHHGVAVPLAGGNYLISVATPERISRDPEVSSLPNGFVIVDKEMNLIHSLNEEDDPQRNCIGFHGSGHIGDDYAFGCDQVLDDPIHGGILMVEYDAGSETYTSRKLNYPELPEGFRTGTITDHKDANAFVGNLGNFRVPGLGYLVSFNSMSPQNITETQLLALSDDQCSFKIELTSGQLLLVWLPDGNLRVYTFEPSWSWLAEIKVLDNTTECTGTLVAGHSSAYILTSESIIEVDIQNLAVPSIRTVPIDYEPFTGTVAGVPKGHVCAAPRLPSLPPASANVFKGWALLLDPVVSGGPGSQEMMETITYVRRSISSALKVPMTRVYILATQDADPGMYLRLGFEGEGSSGEELAAEFAKQVVNTTSDLNSMVTFDTSNILIDSIPTN